MALKSSIQGKTEIVWEQKLEIADITIGELDSDRLFCCPNITKHFQCEFFRQVM